MILEQFYLGCLAQASYLVADETSRLAVVIDPRRDVDDYLDFAAKNRLNIGHIYLTHFHADFAAGHLELAARTGARIHLGAEATADYPFTAARDGERLALGPTVSIETRETPGHTPESICLVVWDLGGAIPRPHAVLTGDTLFIGDVGRPDLAVAAGWRPEDLAGHLWDSIQTKLLTLPDETLVYPGHGAGSACGKNLSKDRFSTVGAQRKLNAALSFSRREDFVASLTADLPKAPAYFAHDADWNRRQHPTLDESLASSLRPLSLDDALRASNSGAVLLDVREADAWAASHLPGSIHVGLGGNFASYAGSVIDPARPLVLIAEPGREHEAAMRLGRIGFDRVIGYLSGGASSFAGHPDLVESAERIDAAELDRRLASPEPPLVLDVRTPAERERGAIPASLHIPLAELLARVAEVPTGRPIAVHCGGGVRSPIAASLLAAAGHRAVADVRGGYSPLPACTPALTAEKR